MATSISSYIPALVFSYELDEISFFTDLPRLTIRVSWYGETLFQTSLYAFEFKASFFNANEIVEMLMKEKKLSFTKFSVEYLDDDELLGELELNVIYCAHNLGIDAASFAEQHFLTTLEQKVIAPNSTALLAFYHDVEESVPSVNCVFYDRNNTFYSTTIQWPALSFSMPGVHNMTIETDAVLASLAELGYNDVQLASFSVAVGLRQFAFYISAVKPDVEFSFLNIFNVPEVASFSAVTTAKTSVDRSIAKLCNKAVFYNQQTEKSYDVQTAPLHRSVAMWVEQIFESADVRLGNNFALDELPEIIITDSTAEITDNDAELNRVKFSWRFAEERVHHFFDAHSARIFQQQFTTQFN